MVVGLLLADGFSALCEICEGLSYGNEFRKGSLLPPLDPMDAKGRSSRLGLILWGTPWYSAGFLVFDNSKLHREGCRRVQGHYASSQIVVLLL